jgi:hypothetical protein
MIAGAPGKPTRRVRCCTVISVGEGMAAFISNRGHGRDISAEALRGNHGQYPNVFASQRNKSQSFARCGAESLSVPSFLASEPLQVAGRLGNEPISEGDDLRERRCRLRADDPVSFGQAQFLGKRAHQAPIDQVYSGQGGTCENNALTIDSSSDGHAHAVQHGSMCEFDAVNSRCFHPSGPILAVVHVDHGKLEHIGWSNETIAPGEQLGTCQTGNSYSGARRTISRPGQLPSPWRTARSTSWRAKST